MRSDRNRGITIKGKKIYDREWEKPKMNFHKYCIYKIKLKLCK